MVMKTYVWGGGNTTQSTDGEDILPSTQELVVDRFADVDTWTSQWSDLTQQYLTDITSVVTGTHVNEINIFNDWFKPNSHAPDGDELVSLEISEPPEFGMSVVKAGEAALEELPAAAFEPEEYPDFDQALELEQLPAAGGFEAETYPELDPSLGLDLDRISPPEPTMPEAPPDPPDPAILQMPAAPSLDLPSVPRLEAIDIPAIEAPEWAVLDEGSRPDLELLSPPGELFAVPDEEYDDEFLNQIRGVLQNRLVEGGTGLGSLYEEALKERTRARLREDLLAEEQKVIDGYPGRNLGMPPGALFNLLQELSNQHAKRMEELERDIYIKNAELAHEYGKFILQECIALEELRIRLHNDSMNRQFQAAVEAARFGFQVYESRRNAFLAQIELLKADVATWEARIRQDIAKAEAQKIFIERARIESDVQKNLVEIYEKQVQGVLAVIELYKAEVEGAKIKADAEAARLESYKLRNEIYVAQIEAVRRQYDVYVARLTGRELDIKAYQAEVDAGYKLAERTRMINEGKIAEANFRLSGREMDIRAYQAEVEAQFKRAERVKMINEGRIAEANLQLAENQQKIDEFRARIERINSEVSAQAAAAQANAAGFQSQLAGYQAYLQARTARHDASIDIYKAKAGMYTSYKELALKQAEVNAQNLMKAHELQVETVNDIAKVTAQLTSSFASAVSASASINSGWNKSVSYNSSFDQTKHLDTGIHYSYNTYVNESGD